MSRFKPSAQRALLDSGFFFICFSVKIPLYEDFCFKTLGMAFFGLCFSSALADAADSAVRDFEQRELGIRDIGGIWDGDAALANCDDLGD